MQLLSTKLTIPPLRSRLVARPRLIQKLNQAFECGFVLVSAPAGFGKSTLLSAWLNQLKTPSVWISLDESENDPVRFLAYLAAALREIDPAFGKDLELGMQASSLPAVEVLLTSTLNELAQVQQPFCLVLDDYHSIQNSRVHQTVSFLLEHRPAPLHLAIATRSDPPLPLARLRACFEMVELRQADLCFNAQETAAFLNYTMGVHISPEDVGKITSRTEGWIAGLQMAALSMQNSDDISSLISELIGNNYYIFEYLLKEILEHQTSETQRFLLYTSILDRFCAPLCDALLVDNADFIQSRPSAVILDELEHANLFIIPLDHDHRWFRYHPLFSDLTRLLLEKTYPERIIGLHRRACRWYEAQEMIPEALQHAISSGDKQLVAQIVSANVLVLVENDEVMPTLRKIDSLPTDDLIALPWLGIARVWVLGVGYIQQSQLILDEVEKSLEDVPDSEERQRMIGHIAAARAFIFCSLGDTTNTIVYARMADELLPPDEIAVRAMNLTRWGDVLIDNQNDLSAIPILEEALALALKGKKPYVAMIAYAALGSANHHAGRLRELHRVCLQGLATAEDYQKRYQRPLTLTAEIYSLLARVMAEWGEGEQAIQFAQKGLLLSERWGEISTESLCLCYLGRILVINNHPEQARQMFQRADSLAQKISPWFWQNVTIFALDSLLDCEEPDSSEIDHLIQRLQESGASYPVPLTARLLLRDNHPDEALVLLGHTLSDLLGQPPYDIVRIHALRALAYQAKGNEKQALDALRQALELGEPENRVVSFVREGAAMEKLLRLASTKSLHPQFVGRLLATFESRRKPVLWSALVAESLVEPLSQRELQVLQLLGQGYTDKQIAATLIVTKETIHQHLKNIYSKLDVHSRTEAIVRAQKLGLL